ncbi:MAG: hypothetical protein U0736_07230 [Gemmataceae bacterium]
MAREDLPAANNARMKLGQTLSGRYLQVIYTPDEDPASVFVITAYELRGRAKRRSVAGNGGNHIERAEAAPGWDQARIREVIAHYENQTEDEQLRRSRRRGAQGVTLMAVPDDLVPEVRALLLARKRTA